MKTSVQKTSSLRREETIAVVNLCCGIQTTAEKQSGAQLLQGAGYASETVPHSSGVGDYEVILGMNAACLLSSDSPPSPERAREREQ